MRVTSAASLLFSTVTLAQEFTNPVIWQDLADNEVHRVDDTFYLTASTMHYSPGAPVLRSYDLVNWDYIGHSVPVLDWSPDYDLADGGSAYVRGIWASSLRHRPANGLWYFLACTEGSTWIYTASDPAGPWTQLSSIASCYYDAGLLFDDDDTPYVAYGNSEIHVAQLSADATSPVDDQVVFNAPDDPSYLEGARMYKKDDTYYIFLTQPANAQWMLKSSSPWGPYELANIISDVTLASVPGAGAPHQGSLVDTPSGDWYYMAFSDMYPGGRCPVLAPVTWPAGGFPEVQLDANGAWGNYAYPVPGANTSEAVERDASIAAFDTLDDEWEWNHNPDTSGFSLESGQLVLSTVTVTSDLYAARNTLTKRIKGPVGTGTLEMDVSGMADGDRAGLAMLRDSSAWIAVEKEGDVASLIVVTGATMTANWETESTGSVVARVDAIDAQSVLLRAEADIEPGASGLAFFSYSLDGGQTYENLGPEYELNTAWNFFMGYRYGIFNFATKDLGGEVRVSSFTSA